MMRYGEIKREMASRDRYLQQPRHKFDGFAAKRNSGEPFFGEPGVAVKICSERDPCCALVTLYAKMGLHRYNLLHRTNFKFLCVDKYNYLIPMTTTTYYITLVAMDPATSHPQTFQTRLDEYARGDDDDETNKTRCLFRPTNLPEWPPENPFDQFYVPDESELQHYEWVRLYLELAIAISNRSQSHDLANVKIVKVAIDTSMEEEGLNAKNATVYIRYKDSCVARVGKEVDRIAIVRRSFDEHTGRFALEGQSSPGIVKPEKEKKNLTSPLLFSPRLFSLWVSNPVDFDERLILEGQNQSSPSIMMPENDKILEGQNQSSASIMMPKKDKIRSARMLFSRRLGVHKPWRLSSHRRHKAYKNPGVRRLHKTRSI